MSLKQILIDAKSKIENEMNIAINNNIAKVNASDIQPRIVELESSKNAAIKQKTEETNAKIEELKKELTSEITQLNEQCEETKKIYKEQKIAEATAAVQSNYAVEISKLEEQIKNIGENI